MASINIQIEEQLIRELEARARESGVTPSEIVREALTRHLQSPPAERTCLDLAREIGLIGCADGLPADLSANADDFEGFGRD